jgi:pimeloyl-ACP methyl ester carboxylesterase
MLRPASAMGGRKTKPAATAIAVNRENLGEQKPLGDREEASYQRVSQAIPSTITLRLLRDYLQNVSKLTKLPEPALLHALSQPVTSASFGQVLNTMSAVVGSALLNGVSSMMFKKLQVAGSATALCVGLLASIPPAHAQATGEQQAEDRSIRPFTIQVPQSELDDLRRRIAATRWSDRETVSDRSQGVQLEKLQALVAYWGTDYDWRRAEAKLNALPQFITTIDGLDIHFIHVRSPNPNALPLIMTHGWPGSVFEMLNTINPLTDPVAHGARAEDAFHLILPSMPGYGFSGKPTGTGWNPDRIARAWAELMTRLGYTRYVAQGGDWGAPISSAMARQSAPGLLGIHINLPATVPPDVAAILAAGMPAPTGLSPKERAAFDSLDIFYKNRRAYAAMMGTRPQVIGQALADTPAGLAAFMYDYNDAEPERLLTKEEFLDDVTLYWLTNTATSSARLYWETAGQSVILAAAQKTSEISLPVAISVFPEEVYRAPESWARGAYRNLIYFNEVDRGGHFAAWEEPELFVAELRSAFRSLRSPSVITIQ